MEQPIRLERGPSTRTERDADRLFALWGQGDAEAFGEIIPLVYQELKRVAHRILRRGEGPQTLQTTELVNELYLKMKGRVLAFDSRRAFFSFAAKTMRHLLVDHVRTRLSQKQGGQAVRATTLEFINLSDGQPIDFATLLLVDQLLTRLAKQDPRQARCTELRFFLGMGNEEVAAVMNLSLSTVNRDWKMAKRWFSRELARAAAPA